MAISALDYPTDIRWERICVSTDMLDPHGCDEGSPPRWNSSIAAFRYVPEDEYQVYENRRIVYYKIACTITSYQPKADEITGAIDWSRLTSTQISDFQKKLLSYLPCNGAVVQVSVTPQHPADLDDYPYILDFQPKTRTLYEQVVDSQERGSRSLETLNVRKGGGTTQSTEVLDIDQGFSAGVQGSYAGAGGGVNVSQTGTSGTRQVTQDDMNNVRTVDGSRESRDTLSHTTQLSQMYTLFQGYHLGTNLGLFFITPRPHLVEEPSGFIQGPQEARRDPGDLPRRQPGQGSGPSVPHGSTRHVASHDSGDVRLRPLARTWRRRRGRSHRDPDAAEHRLREHLRVLRHS